jgi:hypothetical protein
LPREPSSPAELLFLIVEEQKDNGVPVEEVNYVDQVEDNPTAPSLSVHSGLSDVLNKRASPSERCFFFQNNEENVEEPTEDYLIQRKKTARRKRHGLRKESKVEDNAAAPSLSGHLGVFGVIDECVGVMHEMIDECVQQTFSCNEGVEEKEETFNQGGRAVVSWLFVSSCFFVFLFF